MFYLYNSGGDYYLRFRVDTDLGEGTSYVDVTEALAGAPATDGTWYTYRASVDISERSGKIFIDRLDVAAAVNAPGSGTSIFSADAPFLVGAAMSSGSPVNFFDGVIDAVVVAATYTATHSEPLNVTPSTTYISNMAGLWNFNGSSYADDMPAGNDLTGVNAPTFVDGYPFQL